jgi:non-specific serine/threonine protein kinase
VLLEGALERPAGERGAFINAACAGDQSLQHEVESLIASHQQARSFLEAPALAGSKDDASLVGRTLGAYRILARLGSGGMGEVFLAQDSRLGRKVALKFLPEAVSSDRERLQRFHQEASAASALNHPNILVIHEIGEAEGRHFIATEHVEGETLRERMSRGRLGVSEAVDITRQVARGLTAAHAAGIVHRDVKPANIMLRRDGYAKLLDFGLAKLAAAPEGGVDPDAETLMSTTPGILLGTVAYMSPEQARGLKLDARTDVWSLGVVLFEMLTGRVPFEGSSGADVLSAILAKDPVPPRRLASEIPLALERIVLKALEKERTERYQTVEELAAAVAELERRLERGTSRVRRVPQGSRTKKRPTAPDSPAKTRLIALPFRILRTDDETDFLAFSLPDAITSSLSGLDSIVVRSSLVAAHFGSERLDVKRIAAEADVDVVLTGTLLRAGEQLRVCTQLVEASAGTVVWSLTSHLTLREIFQVHDDLVQRIVASLSLPLTAHEQRLLKQDVPASPRAYEFYLRANQLMQRIGIGAVEAPFLARDLYLRCLEDDPRYAPAWARLGRCYRLIGKSGGELEQNLGRAESCLQRALELNPDLALAHKLYAQLETDLGRVAEAMSRLLRRTHPGSTDAELFAGLVHTCRYCGLFEASVAAHERARRLDPTIATGVRHTYWLLGEYERALQDMGTDPVYFDALVLASMGREGEAISILQAREQKALPEAMHAFVASLRALLEGKREESLEATERCFTHFRDPEARYYLARQLARLGAQERALEEMRRVVEQGFYCSQVLARDIWLEPLRSAPKFGAIVQRAEDHRRRAAESFLKEGGDRLLDVRPGPF